MYTAKTEDLSTKDFPARSASPVAAPRRDYVFVGGYKLLPSLGFLENLLRAYDRLEPGEPDPRD